MSITIEVLVWAHLKEPKERSQCGDWATGLEYPGIEFRQGKTFFSETSKVPLGLIGRGLRLTTYLHLVPRLRMSGVIGQPPPPPSYDCMVGRGKTLPLEAHLPHMVTMRNAHIVVGKPVKKL